MKKFDSNYIKKIGVLFLVLLFTPVISGLYGILHDQITYTICPEYYTKFKFYQFKIVVFENEGDLPNPRIYVALTGLIATWWTGLIIGVVHGYTGLKHKDHKVMLKMIVRAILITLITTVVAGLIGFFAGKFVLENPKWIFPDNLIDKKNFIVVGAIHNSSYLGGLLGLILGVVYQVNIKSSRTPLSQNPSTP